jgi:glutamate-1-semialdehyde 2,1-aminomutase
MDWLAPLGPVYQAGTLSGNPLAMAAGIAALQELSKGRTPKSEIKSGTGVTSPSEASAYVLLEQLGSQLEAGMSEAAKSAKIPMTFNRCGSMFCGYFTGAPVWNLADAMKSDRERFKKFFHGMLAEGVYLAPSQFESGFISTAHTTADISRTVRAVAKVLRRL